MTVVLTKGYLDDEHAEPINGRPDLCRETQDFGVTLAKSHPPYVFSVMAGAALIHEIAYVELHWYRVSLSGGHKLIKMKRPHMIAKSICGYAFHLEGKRARTCRVPNPDAVLCGRCNGEVASLSLHGAATKAGISRPAASVKLGCVVQGY